MPAVPRTNQGFLGGHLPLPKAVSVRTSALKKRQYRVRPVSCVPRAPAGARQPFLDGWRHRRRGVSGHRIQHEQEPHFGSGGAASQCAISPTSGPPTPSRAVVLGYRAVIPKARASNPAILGRPAEIAPARSSASLGSRAFPRISPPNRRVAARGWARATPGSLVLSDGWAGLPAGPGGGAPGSFALTAGWRVLTAAPLAGAAGRPEQPAVPTKQPSVARAQPFHTASPSVRSTRRNERNSPDRVDGLLELG